MIEPPRKPWLLDLLGFGEDGRVGATSVWSSKRVDAEMHVLLDGDSWEIRAQIPGVFTKLTDIDEADFSTALFRVTRGRPVVREPEQGTSPKEAT